MNRLLNSLESLASYFDFTTKDLIISHDVSNENVIIIPKGYMIMLIDPLRIFKSNRDLRVSSILSENKVYYLLFIDDKKDGEIVLSKNWIANSFLIKRINTNHEGNLVWDTLQG